MACFRKGGYSCFGPSFPCDVWTSTSECDSNTVVNPPVLPSFALFTLDTGPSVVASGALIPVILNSVSGTSILQPAVGEIYLSAGQYMVTFSVTSEVGGSGLNSFGLTLNEVAVPASTVSAAGTIGSAISLTNTITLDVSTPSILKLVNLGEDGVSVNMANVVIQRIN